MKNFTLILCSLIGLNGFAQDPRLVEQDFWLIEKITLGGEDYLSPLNGLPLNGGNGFSENPNEFLFGYCDAYSTSITYNGDTEFDLPINPPAVLLGFCTVQAEITFDSRLQEIFYAFSDHNGPFTYEIIETGDNTRLIITNVSGDKAYYNSEVLAAIDENNQRFVSLYPNPAKDRLTLSLEATNTANVTIYNILGNKVMETSIATSSSQLPIETLVAGVYLMNVVTSDGQKQTLKFIKE